MLHRNTEDKEAVKTDDCRAVMLKLAPQTVNP